MTYNPSFHLSEKVVNLTAEIAESVGLISASLCNELLHPRLRKENRIKTIQSSLAIENNTLTLEQVTAILDGKRVLGSPQEIQEVKNAFETYELLLNFNPFSGKDMLLAHQILMKELVKDNGKFRNKSVGISDGNRIIHVAPPFDRVPFLVNDLLEWFETSQLHPLIKSFVFHYEFEFIHPFSDGNGRMGRLWQTLILAKWNTIFAWLPVETIVKENQTEYYQSLQLADNLGDCATFIEFMLQSILQAVNELKKDQNVGVNVVVNEKTILDLITLKPAITAKEIALQLKMSIRQTERYLASLKDKGLIIRVGADKNGAWKIIES
jgi:Fic family protein